MSAARTFSSSRLRDFALGELGHSPDALLDGHVWIDARQAKDGERLDAEIFQALLAGLAQIARIGASAHGVWGAFAWLPLFE